MTLDDALITFMVECSELLQDMETALLGFGAGPADAETVNAIFRAAHTIKGSAGLFGLDEVVAFTHVAESVLDKVRQGQCTLDDKLVALLLECRDHIGHLLERSQQALPVEDSALTAAGELLVRRLQCFLSTPAPIGPPGDLWRITLQFGQTVLQNGMDPMAFLRYLGTLGSLARVTVLDATLPALELLDPESCYLGLDIWLSSSASKADIEAVFDFVRDDCTLVIAAPESTVREAIDLIVNEEQSHERLGDTLLRTGSVTRAELAAALHQQASTSVRQPIGEILVANGAAAKPLVDAVLKRQDKTREGKNAEGGSIRVDADKLDNLINLVGELIISSASANLIARRAQNVQFQECSATLSALVEEVRNSALQLRMVKIGATFGRFQRVVHDVSRELGKDIVLHVSGEDTELDKTVVEKIGDPLTHLVRNAMDHGIEAAPLRLARGKPAEGAITLHARHDAGAIVIEVVDDGGGLSRERILNKAIERGLVDSTRILSDAEVFALVFEPGFSTAEKVTNMSGRGVGMDVVKRNVSALRGTVAIDSEEGIGTKVTVRLPLTLAIINGFQVAVGKTVFVIPLDMVEECVEHSAIHGRDYADLRGQVLPLIRLRSLFEIVGAAGARQSVVVVRYAGQRAGLVVDHLLGESQTVIKPLGKVFEHIDCISGSSILGSGEVALIVDVPALIRVGQNAATTALAAEVDMT